MMQEFGCLPFPGALTDQPWPLMQTIMALRNYARCYEIVEVRKAEWADAPQAHELVLEIETLREIDRREGREAMLIAAASPP